MSMHVTLDAIKQHLNIDDDFNKDDNYLVELIEVCEKSVERAIDVTIDELKAKNQGECPSPVLHAVKLLVGNFYMNRESIAYAQAYELPQSFNYLLDLYRNYKGGTSL